MLSLTLLSMSPFSSVSLLASCSVSAVLCSISAHVSFLFVCSALWCLYYYYCVLKSWQDWKDTGTTKAAAAAAAGLGVGYVEWHLHFERGRWNKPPHFYNIWHPRFSCSTTSSPPPPSLPAIVAVSLSLSLSPLSIIYHYRHTLSIISWYQVWRFGNDRE